MPRTSVRPELVEGLPLSFWTYLLHCNGGYFYAGHTDDIDRRMAQHATSQVKGFVRDHWPAKLVWSAEFPTRYEALAMERRIKGWSRAKKMALIRSDWTKLSELAKAKDSPSTSSGRTELKSDIPEERDDVQPCDGRVE